MPGARQEIQAPRVIENIIWPGGYDRREYDQVGAPHSLEATMESIWEYERDERFSPGGKYELLDTNGEFKLHNFATWMRYRIMKESGRGPEAPLNALSQVKIQRGIQSFTLDDILNEKRYLQFRHDSTVEFGEHPQMTEGCRGGLIIEAWRAGDTQGRYAKLNESSVKDDLGKFLEAFTAMSEANPNVRGLRPFLTNDFLMPAGDDPDEVLACYTKGEQGRLGRAFIGGLLDHQYTPEMTHFYCDRDGDGKFIRLKPILENKAYQARGEDGSIHYFKSLARESLKLKDESLKLETDDELLKYLADPEREKLLQKEVYLVDGRIVDEKQCKKVMHLGENDVIGQASDIDGTGRVTVRAIVGDFRVNHVDDAMGLDAIRRYGEQYVKREKLPADKRQNFDDLCRDEISGKMLLARQDVDLVRYGRLRTQLHSYVKFEDLKTGYDNAILEHEARLKRYERLAFALLDKAAGLKREDLNIFNTSEPRLGAMSISRSSLRGYFGGKHNLNADDAKYAEMRVWYVLRQLFIPGGNNVSGSPSGTDQSVNFSKFGNYLRHHDKLGTLHHGEDAFEAFMPPNLLHVFGLQVEGEEMPLLAAMQGNRSNNGQLDMTEIKPWWERSLNRGKILMKENQEVNFAGILAQAFKIHHMIKESRLMLAGVAEQDFLLRMNVNKEKMMKQLADMYKAFSYTLDKHGYDYNTKIFANGKSMTLAEYMFGEKTREIIEVMRSGYLGLAEKSDERTAEMYRGYAKEIGDKPGVAGFMSVLLEGIANRTVSKKIFDSDNHHHHSVLDANQVEVFRWAVKEFLGEPGKNMPSMMPGELFDKLFKVYGTSIGGLWLWEIFFAALGMVFSAARGGMSLKDH